MKDGGKEGGREGRKEGRMLTSRLVHMNTNEVGLLLLRDHPCLFALLPDTHKAVIAGSGSSAFRTNGIQTTHRIVEDTRFHLILR